MTYHATSSTEDAESLARMTLSPAISAQLHTFSFTDTHLEDVETLAVGTSLPYFGVKLSCVCLMFAYRKKQPIVTVR